MQQVSKEFTADTGSPCSNHTMICSSLSHAVQTREQHLKALEVGCFKEPEPMQIACQRIQSAKNDGGPAEEILI